MIRVLLAIGLALYVALAAGEVSVLGGFVCAEQCPDDDSDGQCAPDCADCACCPHLRLSASLVEVSTVLPGQAQRVLEQPQAQPPSPDVDDILHVPKAISA
ncbi:MAG: hypothetical protein JNG84_03155 [Archangium sp.]|nr:hypothetical protein [Archangium sp.]